MLSGSRSTWVESSRTSSADIPTKLRMGKSEFCLKRVATALLTHTYIHMHTFEENHSLRIRHNYKIIYAVPFWLSLRRVTCQFQLISPIHWYLGSSTLACPFRWSIFGHLLLRPTKFHAAMQPQSAVAAQLSASSDGLRIGAPSGTGQFDRRLWEAQIEDMCWILWLLNNKP